MKLSLCIIEFHAIDMRVCVCVFVNLAACQHLALFFLFKTCGLYIYIYMIIHPVINLYDHQTVKMFESKFGGKTARQFLYRKKL